MSMNLMIIWIIKFKVKQENLIRRRIEKNLNVITLTLMAVDKGGG